VFVNWRGNSFFMYFQSFRTLLWIHRRMAFVCLFIWGVVSCIQNSFVCIFTSPWFFQRYCVASQMVGLDSAGLPVGLLYFWSRLPGGPPDVSKCCFCADWVCLHVPFPGPSSVILLHPGILTLSLSLFFLGCSGALFLELWSLVVARWRCCDFCVAQ